MIKDALKSIYWNFKGIMLRNPPIPVDVKSILFICKGNICRSPFAEHIARKYLLNLMQCKITSAGLLVDEPIAPPLEAVEAAKRFEVDIGNHKSKSVNFELIESHDMVFVMEAWQFNFLRNIFLGHEKKFFLLPLYYCKRNEFGGAYNKYNIRDPYGRSLDDYSMCYNRICRCISEFLSSANISTGLKIGNS